MPASNIIPILDSTYYYSKEVNECLAKVCDFSLDMNLTDKKNSIVFICLKKTADNKVYTYLKLYHDNGTKNILYVYIVGEKDTVTMNSTTCRFVDSDKLPKYSLFFEPSDLENEAGKVIIEKFNDMVKTTPDAPSFSKSLLDEYENEEGEF